MRELVKFNAIWKCNSDKIENKKNFTDVDATVAIVGGGIYNGVYFPTEELQKSLNKWDKKPLCLDHSDSILHEIGYISEPKLVENKLVVKPHIANYTKYAEDALNWIKLRKEAGKTPEVSISAWVDTDFEEIEGFKDKVKVARNIEPVHLALVTEGACSPEDGCGIGIAYSYDSEWNTVLQDDDFDAVDVVSDDGSVTMTFSPADVSIIPSNFYQEDEEEVDMVKKKANLGVVPSNPKGYGKDATGAWSAPSLKDFTGKTWSELTDKEKKAIASCFAWSPKMPPERFTDLKLPHHNPKSKAVVWRGVAAAMAALMGARGGVDIPEADKRKVYNHLAKHYREFEKEPPSFEAVLRGEVMTEEEKVENMVEEEETTTEEEAPVEEEKVENKESSEVVELKKKIEEYEQVIAECKKAREELQAKCDELKAELEKIAEEKKKLEEMRGKPKVANEKTEEKELTQNEYERLKELMKKI